MFPFETKLHLYCYFVLGVSCLPALWPATVPATPPAMGKQWTYIYIVNKKTTLKMLAPIEGAAIRLLTSSEAASIRNEMEK